jgi:phage gpG-like protein
MAGAPVVRVDTSEIAGTIYRLQAKGKALSGLMPAFAEELVSAVSDVYEAEGPGWYGLAESTMYSMRKSRRTSYKILQDTGAMAGHTSPGYGGDWAEAYAPESYADFHATGTRFMRKRNPFDLGPFEEEVLESLADMALIEVTQ